MENFKDNAQSTCQSIYNAAKRVAVPILVIGGAMWAGSEIASDLLNISWGLGAFAGLSAGSFAWLVYEAKNAPTETELFGCELVGIVEDRDKKIDFVKKNPEFDYYDVQTDGPEGFQTFVIGQG